MHHTISDNWLCTQANRTISPRGNRGNRGNRGTSQNPLVPLLTSRVDAHIRDEQTLCSTSHAGCPDRSGWRRGSSARHQKCRGRAGVLTPDRQAPPLKAGLRTARAGAPRPGAPPLPTGESGVLHPFSPRLMHARSRAYPPYRLFRSAIVGVIVALTVFEVMLRVLRLGEGISGLILGLALVPAIVTALVRQVAALLADPDGHLPTLGFAFASILLTIVFFAFIYLELGIYSPANPEREVNSFLVCLYFSASTITTTGLGEFVPRPETRFIATLEMMFGYFAFGIVTAATFFLLDHRSGRRIRGDRREAPRTYRP
jgi:hypothetical protein